MYNQTWKQQFWTNYLLKLIFSSRFTDIWERGWHCSTVSKASLCNACFPYKGCSESQLLHFQFSSLKCSWESRRKWPKCLSSSIPVWHLVETWLLALARSSAGHCSHMEHDSVDARLVSPSRVTLPFKYINIREEKEWARKRTQRSSSIFCLTPQIIATVRAGPEGSWELIQAGVGPWPALSGALIGGYRVARARTCTLMGCKGSPHSAGPPCTPWGLSLEQNVVFWRFFSHGYILKTEK